VTTNHNTIRKEAGDNLGSVGSWFDTFFDPEDGGEMFFQIIGSHCLENFKFNTIMIILIIFKMVAPRRERLTARVYHISYSNR
jgi:hypothetical protein